MGVPSPPVAPTSFIVSPECRDILAMSVNFAHHTACKEVDFDNKRPFCELHDSDDTQRLADSVRISGATQVHVDGLVHDCRISSALAVGILQSCT